MQTRPDFAEVVRIVERMKREPREDSFSRYGGLRLKPPGALVVGLDYVSFSGVIR